MQQGQYADIPDDVLIRAVLNGNTEQFSILVQKYQRAVYALGRRFLRNEDDTADFVQEIFIKAYSSLSGFRGKSSFYTWLMRIAYNAGVNSVKRTKIAEQLDDESVDASAETPERLHLKKEIRTALNDAVADLPDRYAICLDLYFFFGVPYQDISEITDIPLNTVKSNVFRAKKMLRKSLNGTAAEAGYDL
jgi:RNA polymerase sigma-70 factor, ECF subfamily